MYNAIPIRTVSKQTQNKMRSPVAFSMFSSSTIDLKNCIANILTSSRSYKPIQLNLLWANNP